MCAVLEVGEKWVTPSRNEVKQIQGFILLQESVHILMIVVVLPFALVMISAFHKSLIEEVIQVTSKGPGDASNPVNMFFGVPTPTLLQHL